MAYPDHSPGVRFWRKFVTSDTGCWLWTGPLTRKGYGRFKVADKPIQAHRWAYAYLRGPIPEGLTIDHLCRMRHCVNPRHMEVVTSRENTLRGFGVAAQYARRAHCK